MPEATSPFKWFVMGGDPSNQASHYFEETHDALEFCGKLLYGNQLFSILYLTFRREDKKLPERISNEFCSDLKAETEWVLVRLRDGEIQTRQLSSTHELFCMLVAELRLGSDLIEVRHISNIVAE